MRVFRLALSLLLLLVAVGLASPARAGEVLRCVTCGGAIQGRYRYIEVDGQRYSFHAQHKPATCWFCGGVLAPSTPWGPGLHTPEGFDCCSLCNADAVRDTGTAQALLEEVRQGMVGWGLTFPWGRIPVQLVGTAELPARGNWHELGRCHTRRVARDDGDVANLTVQLLRGMPRAVFKGVAAHELTHAWSQLKHCPLNQDPELREGGANIVEYFYLQPDTSSAGRHLKKMMLAERTGAYGSGMHRLLRYAESHRVRGVLALLATQRSIPAGY